ncbi:MAG: S-adenosylmethionine:tRNA ribosyltransferase-isomerase [Bacteroidales bacterium]|nr:S-adenosylmethionine:tRNA ribosyltransferase-isomerase [Bacteroidales bacterium]
MIVEPIIKIKEYTYLLPENRIAKFPLEQRDLSKILIFRDNIITENKFSNLDKLLPNGSLMIFNHTKVLPARLLFKKETGAHIEIFCLEPHNPIEYNLSFNSKKTCSWVAVVGNANKWKSNEIFFDIANHKNLKEIDLRATLEGKIDSKFIVNFSWKGDYSFSEILDLCGKVPIPPYLNRDSVDEDKERYQTLYAKIKGSVAAPTAGLHFSDRVLSNIDKRGVEREEVVLHVGAGTFVPVKSEEIKDHKMHSEPFSLTIDLLEKLLKQLKKKRPIIAVGTTTARTLESLYWLGIQCLNNGSPGNITQWEPYNDTREISVEESLTYLISWMKKNRVDILERKTEIIIVPGYKFRLIDILITNFHQPQSTLLLLIAAFTGEKWKNIYNYALSNEFRFLSYGDSSILFRTST